MTTPLDDYNELRPDGWWFKWVALFVAAFMLLVFAAAIAFAAYTVRDLLKPAAPVAPVVNPYTPVVVPVYDPAQPLADNPQFAQQIAQTKALLTGSPYAKDVVEIYWGSAAEIGVGVNTIPTPQAVNAGLAKTGRLAFGQHRALPPPIVQGLDAIALTVIGTDPTKLTPERRNHIVQGLRAMAYGAQLAAN